MENCSELFCNKSLHGLAGRHSNLFDDVIVIYITIVSVKFSHNKNLQIHVNACIAVNVLGGISFHVMVHLYFCCFLCVRTETESC